jgi:SAM-dependent methyltransferase
VGINVTKLKAMGTASTGPGEPYDWDNYETDWHSNETYEAQEEAIVAAIESIELGSAKAGSGSGPFDVLEVGPGFGRITRLLLADFANSIRRYFASDISGVALAKAAAFASVAACDGTFDWTATKVGPLQDPSTLAGFPRVDLVVAIEVLMHIPPNEARLAAEHLLSRVKPGGALVTCDWGVDLGPKVLVRNWNYRHAYRELYEDLAPKGSVITVRTIGLQSLCTVKAKESR